MGLSYTIIPTNEMVDKQAYIEHFNSIETYEFPNSYEIDTNSRYPKLTEIETVLFNSGCLIIDKTEEIIKGGVTSRSYQLIHPKHKYESDFTVHFRNQEIETMIGIHGDFNILLRIVTQLTKVCGTMIIWSAYDAHYIDKEKTYEQIWSKLKDTWSNNE